MHERNKQRVIENNQKQQKEAALVNPDKIKADVKQRYRLRNPDRSRAFSRQSVSKYEMREPEKAKAATRTSVFEYRMKESGKVRAATRTSVFKYRMREPGKARAATRLSVSAYRKRYPDVNNRLWVAKYYKKCMQ